MTKKINEKAKTVTTDTKTVVHNLSRLVESASLLVVAGYAFNQAYHGGHNAGMKVVLASSLVIGLRGSCEFLRYLANKEIK